MPAQKSDEETVISSAVDLFRRFGYHKTTMAEVGEASGLLKGSLYHYFSGKEQLAIIAMKQIHAHFRTYVFPYATASGLSAKERLARLADATFQYFSGRQGGCLIGNFALETIDSVPDFRPTIEAYFSDWIVAYQDVYGALGETPEHAGAKAREAVALIQGALMMNRVFGNDRVLRDVVTRLGSVPGPQ